MFRKLRFCFILFFSLYFSISLAEENTQKPEENNHNSEISIGIGQYFFMGDLTSLYAKSSLGGKLSYAYGLEKNQYVSHIRTYLEYTDPAKDGHINPNYILGIGIDYPFYQISFLSLIARPGLEMTHWERSKKYFLEQISINQVFFGAMLGSAVRFDLKNWGAFDLSFEMHAQEYSLSTRYLSIYAQYIWRFF